MPNPYFSFKQFTVFHDKCAMKVGIDGVLLGAWAEIGTAQHILDVGTGTGLIGLMLAQRSNSAITAIDIDADAALQARTNVMESPWPERMSVHQASLQEYAANAKLRYDLIVSNPPYFVNSTKTPLHSRTLARHTDTLTHEELIENSMKLLQPDGRICLILPVAEGIECMRFGQTIGLHCSKMVRVYPKPGSEAKRLLLEFSTAASDCHESELTIESTTRHQYTPEFTELAKDFYLKL